MLIEKILLKEKEIISIRLEKSNRSKRIDDNKNKQKRKAKLASRQ